MGKSSEYKDYITPPFRLSFPHLHEPSSQNGAEPKYGIKMLFPKDTDLTELQNMVKAAAQECWGAGKVPKGIKLPLKDGNGTDYAEDQGHTIASARSKYRVGCVSGDRREYAPEEIQEKLYAGCWARAKIKVGAGDTGGNNYVHFVLCSVQKIRDDEPFTKRRDPTQDFGAVEGFSDEGASGGDW